MATYEMKDHTENNNCYRYAPNFELLVKTAERDEQYELVCRDSLNPASDSQKQDDILEDLCIRFADMSLSGTRKEEINDLNNSTSLTSLCRGDSTSMQEKEGQKGMKLPSVDDIETMKAASKPKVKIIYRRKRNVEPSLRIQLLKKLASKAKDLYALS